MSERMREGGKWDLLPYKLTLAGEGVGMARVAGVTRVAVVTGTRMVAVKIKKEGMLKQKSCQKNGQNFMSD